jgi:hypothetical protein
VGRALPHPQRRHPEQEAEITDQGPHGRPDPRTASRHARPHRRHPPRTQGRRGPTVRHPHRTVRRPVHRRRADPASHPPDQVLPPDLGPRNASQDRPSRDEDASPANDPAAAPNTFPTAPPARPPAAPVSKERRSGRPDAPMVADGAHHCRYGGRSLTYRAVLITLAIPVKPPVGAGMEKPATPLEEGAVTVHLQNHQSPR